MSSNPQSGLQAEDVLYGQLDSKTKPLSLSQIASSLNINQQDALMVLAEADSDLDLVMMIQRVTAYDSRRGSRQDISVQNTKTLVETLEQLVEYGLIDSTNKSDQSRRWRINSTGQAVAELLSEPVLAKQ